MKYHLTPARMALIQESGNSKCCRGCGDKVGGNVNWYSHYGELYGGPLKISVQIYLREETKSFDCSLEGS